MSSPARATSARGAAGSSVTRSRAARAFTHRSASASLSMTPQSTTCASFRSSLTTRRRMSSAPQTNTTVACGGGAFRNASSRSCSSSAALLSRFGMSSFSASSTMTTRRGTIIGSVFAASMRSLDLGLAAVEAIDVEGAQALVDHLGELRRDGGLLDIVVADEHVERLGLAGGDLLAQRGCRRRAGTRIRTPRGWRSRRCGRRRGDAIERSCAPGRGTSRLRSTVLPRVASSYSLTERQRVVRPEHLLVRASVNATLIVSVKQVARRELLIVEADGCTEIASDLARTAPRPPRSPSGTTWYLPRPMNSVRIFSVRTCSTWKKRASVLELRDADDADVVRAGTSRGRPARSRTPLMLANASAQQRERTAPVEPLTDVTLVPTIDETPASLRHDDLLDRLPCSVRLHGRIGQRQPLELRLRRLGRHGQPAAHLAVDLHRNDDLVRLGDRRRRSPASVDGGQSRPRGRASPTSPRAVCGANGASIRTSASTASRTTQIVSRRSSLAGVLDVLVGAARRAAGHRLLAEGVQLVDQLHHRRHGGVELLPLLDVDRHAADRVVRLAAQRPLGGVERRHAVGAVDPVAANRLVPVIDQPPDAREEAEAALRGPASVHSTSFSGGATNIT